MSAGEIKRIKMNSLRIHFKLFLLILYLEINLINCDYENQPKFYTENGALFIESAMDRNITFKLRGAATVKLNDIDLKTMSLSNANPNWGTSGQGRLLNRRITSLNARLNGRRGILSRILALERNGTSSFSTNSTDVNLNLRSQVIELARRVTTIETKVTAIETKLEADNCRSVPCLNGGTCVNGYDKFVCQCPKNWAGETCQEDVNECLQFTGTELGCQNGATCVNEPGSYRCQCMSGFVGIHCARRQSDCNSMSSVELCGHGYCVNTNDVVGYKCVCEPGWKYNQPTTGAPACIVDINECVEDKPQCSKDPEVRCVNTEGSYMCGPCPPGFTGNGYYCTDINECEINNGGCSIAPTVNCRNTHGSSYCDPCPLGFSGNGRVCIRTDNSGLCSEYQGCHPMASCTDYGGNVNCVCPPGYVGNGFGPSGCIRSLTPCNPNPCLNGGSCNVNGTNFACTCPAGFLQPVCQRSNVVDVCDPNPCQNGGTCVRDRPRKRCNCLRGFSGLLCQVQQRECGGLLKESSGILKYPADDSTHYQNNERCAWVIRTNITQILNVTFTKFHLENKSESGDCKFDWLQIHDGQSTASHMIGRFCGIELPNGGNIMSTHNQLYFWFRSDRNDHGEGFELSWETIDPVCGGEIETTSFGNLASPGSPGNYPLNRDCYWHITAPPGKRIKLQFYLLQIEVHPNCSYDSLTISNDRMQTDVIEQFCNRSSPAPIITSGNTVTIYFHTDGFGADTGFQMHYTVEDGFPGCGGVFTLPKGEFGSPTENGVYQSNLLCDYLIRVPLKSRISITFSQFDIEDHSHCSYDYVAVYDGPSDESPLINKYCGINHPMPFRSSGNAIFIKFKSDWSGSNAGFRLNYETICGGDFEENNGIVTTPNYPQPYETELICDFIIQAPLGKAIILNFLDFDMELSIGCRYDYLKIYDGIKSNETELGKYCNDKAPEQIISSVNLLHLEMKSDSSNSGRGFKANYTFIDLECGGIIKNGQGQIKFPSSSQTGSYSNSMNCRWIIYAPIGNVIQLNWASFHLEDHSSCDYDYVQIFDNATNGGGDHGKYCGTNKPPTIRSSGNIVTITFVSDSSNNFDGFTLDYNFVDASTICGGNYFSQSGMIISPGWPSNYQPGKMCEWFITAPKGRQIVLYVIAFETEDTDDCRFDYLEVRNGPSSKSPLIGRFCGSNMTSGLKTYSNRMYLKFVSDISREFKGFVLEYDATSTGCSGVLTSARGEFTSPNYPDSYDHNVECSWLVTVGQGSKIHFVFADLQMEEAMDCYSDMLEFYDGSDSHSKFIGRYCSETNHPLSIETTGNKAFIRMKTDFSYNGRGFHIRYQSLCNVTLTDRFGVIESPNFPNNYPVNIVCKWRIEGPLGSKIHLEFSHFDIEHMGSDSDSCPYDYVKIISDSETIQDQKYCNKSPPKTKTTNNVVEIEFKTDSSGSGIGFRLEYKVDGCGGVLTKDGESFTSPNYPNTYPDSTICNWTIQTNTEQSIELTFNDIDFEMSSSNCEYDAVIISNHPNGIYPIGTYCHTSNSSIKIVGGSTLYVSFKSDTSRGHKGFNATYKFIEKQCGGILIAPTGAIHSPNYPENYNNSITCEWLIQVDDQHQIEMEITDFELENYQNCPHDRFMVYDGATRDKDYLMLKYCGSNKPNITTYNSTSNQMLIVLETDSSQSFKGFALKYRKGCGATILVNDTGIFEVGDLSDSQIINCTWHLRAAEPSQRITLMMNHFSGFARKTYFDNLNCSHDFKFYDGESLSSPVLLEFCGEKTAHKPIRSTGQFLTINLNVEYFMVMSLQQFSAIYTVYDTVCGGEFQSQHGEIASPNYPNSYPLDRECIWEIKVAPGNRVGLVVNALNILSPDDNCNENYLEIREKSEDGRLIGVYCNQPENFNVSDASGFWIKFRSGPTYTSTGFLLEYYQQPNVELVGESGVITSPYYPQPYRDRNIKLTYRITVEFGFVIALKSIDLSAEEYCDFNILAAYDGYDTTAGILKSYCGHGPAETVTSTSNVLYIEFENDMFLPKFRFKFEWRKIAINKEEKAIVDNLIKCSNISEFLLDDPSKQVQLKSPGYPTGYESNLNCTWTISTNMTTHHAVLLFSDVDLEDYPECYGDYVEVFKSHNLVDWTSVSKICKLNEVNLAKPIHGNPYLRVNFISNYWQNGTGFVVELIPLCGNHLTDMNGIIEYSHRKILPISRLGNNTGCMWNITVRPGRRIQFTIELLDLPKKIDVCDGFLMFRNGIDESSPFLGDGKYCGSEIPKLPTTTSNRAFIRFQPGTRLIDNFKIRYEEVSSDCRNEIILTERFNSTVITTPNYPNIPNPYTECTWTITIPSGEKIKVEFIDHFDLELSEGCENEYVALRMGTTDSAQEIGKYCGTIPDSIIVNNNFVKIVYETRRADPNTGFKAKISITGCGAIHRGRYGFITSPDYPSHSGYSGNLNCEYTIIGPIGTFLTLNIIDLDLADESDSTNNCTDRIEIYSKVANTELNGTNLISAGQFCGETVPYEPITTIDNVAVIMFKTFGQKGIDDELTGFKISYNSSESHCGGDLFAETAEIMSPGYPLRRLRTQTCEWLITVPKGRRIKIDIIDLDLLQTPHLYVQKLILFNDHNKINRIGNFTELVGNRTYYSSDNKAGVVFIIRRESGNRGFKLRYTSNEPSICIGDFNQNEGTIKNPENVTSFVCSYNREQPFYRNEPNVGTMALQLTNLQIGYHFVINCTQALTRMVINYGDSKILKELCGNSTTDITIRSPFSNLKIETIRHSNFVRMTYQINYKVHKCGGIVRSDYETILRPESFPNNYGKVDCAWQINKGENEVIIFNLTSFGLKLSCDREYLAVYQGETTNDPQIGRYCGYSNLSESLISQRNHLFIEYHSDNYDPTSTFEIKLTPLANGCGGLMNYHTKYLASPKFNATDARYPNNAECIWEITASQGYHIQLEFYGRFSIEKSDNCANDFVEIFDKVKDEWKSMGRYCDRFQIGPFNSTGTQMKVLFRSNDKVMGDGFKAVWYEKCGGNFVATEEEKFIESPGYPENYKNLVNCNYTITAPAEKSIELFFEVFELEGGSKACSYDNVTIFKRREYYPDALDQLGPYCGVELPPTVVAPEIIIVQFRTDFLLEKAGFRFVYRIQSCGGKILSPTRIESPKMRGSDLHLGSQRCYWNVTAAEGQKITFELDMIDLEYNSQCYFDYLSFYEGETAEDSKRVNRVCGNITGLIVNIPGRHAVMYFHTDTSNHRKGFSGMIKFSKSCDENLELTSNNRVIVLNKLSTAYENNLDCHYVITSEGDTSIKIRFSQLHIAPCTSISRNNSLCSCDYVEIRDGPSILDNIIGTYCGHDTPPEFQSSGQAIHLRFVTDGGTQSTGFIVSFEMIPSLCQNQIIIDNITSVITSPGGDSYPPNTRCLYKLEAPVGKSISIDFERFDLQNPDADDGCTNDYLEIVDDQLRGIIGLGPDMVYTGNSVSTSPQSFYMGMRSPQSHYRYCGSGKPHTYYSTDSKVRLLFVSDSEIEKTGFKLNVRIINSCSRNHTELSGRIKKDGLHNCEFYISVPQNYTITLYFMQFYIPTADCTASYLKIYENNENGKMLAKLCSVDIPDPVYSTTNNIFVRIKIDDPPTYDINNYDIFYLATNKSSACGGELYNYGGMFGSPGYPMNDRNVSDCLWNIAVPSNFKIAFKFSVFNFGSSKYCESNYVQIIEYDTNGGQTVERKYCGGVTEPAVYRSKRNILGIRLVKNNNFDGTGFLAQFIAAHDDTEVSNY